MACGRPAQTPLPSTSAADLISRGNLSWSSQQGQGNSVRELLPGLAPSSVLLCMSFRCLWGARHDIPTFPAALQSQNLASGMGGWRGNPSPPWAPSWVAEFHSVSPKTGREQRGVKSPGILVLLDSFIHWDLGGYFTDKNKKVQRLAQGRGGKWRSPSPPWMPEGQHQSQTAPTPQPRSLPGPLSPARASPLSSS